MVRRHAAKSVMRIVDGIIRRHVAAMLAAAVLSPHQFPVQAVQASAPGTLATPAILPSPIRPTGKMAETCEVVALGREDVCLEFKKVLTAYDELQLGKAKSSLADSLEFVSDAGIKTLLTSLDDVIGMINRNEFDTLVIATKALDVTPLSKADDKKYSKVTADLAAVVARAKEKEASPIARATIKLATDVNACI